MKKAYKSPTSVAFELHSEAMIAASFSINSGEADQWSTKRENGWDSNNWSGSAEDEE
ncbi:MAG: hypothetical protein PUF27_07805 [Bacteroidales bacterium]|nr:hypothetical protein [Bacteroidales bacterium]MDD6537870.1 hypothetical protein [Bacteroidales bacterium]MDD6555502.1 hypothetical protein [Bacteroidales bacterium]